MMKFLEHSIAVRSDLYTQCKELIELAESMTDWKLAVYDNEIRKDLRKCESLFISDLANTNPALKAWDASIFSAFNEGVMEYAKHMNFLQVTNDEGYILMRYKIGDFIAEHSDLAHLDRSVSGVLFLNDDFEGGDLVFPHQNIRVRPQAGMAIFFPSFWNYPHRVEEITSGTRYSIATLFSGKTLTQSKVADVIHNNE